LIKLCITKLTPLSSKSHLERWAPLGRRWRLVAAVHLRVRTRHLQTRPRQDRPTRPAVTPGETAGPDPSLIDLYRSDIRDGRTGTVLTLSVKVVNVNAGCAAVASADVEVWHCDSAGNYSEYGTQTTQNYLRGIQTTNGGGEVTFTTIY